MHPLDEAVASVHTDAAHRPDALDRPSFLPQFSVRQILDLDAPDPDAVAPAEESPAEHLQAAVLLLLRINTFLTQFPKGSETWRKVKDLQKTTRETVAFWMKLIEDRAEESPRKKAIRRAIERSSSRQGVASGYRGSADFNARVKACIKGARSRRSVTRQRGPVLAAARSHRSSGVRTRGSRRCVAAASGEPDPAGGGEPPSTSSHGRSHVDGPPGTRKALAGGFHSLASRARASACFYTGGRP